ncbi:hypothetical protein [Polaribacter aestuariivivens]|nr:hypothetical protein [Polaribacter aestuariivivens]
MAEDKKQNKKRPKKYENKLKINGTLDGVLSVSVPQSKDKPTK